MCRITRIEMTSGGTTHEHITHVLTINAPARWWTVEDVVRRIEAGERFVVGEGRDLVDVHVRVSSTGRKYIQTAADGTWTNNLLALPGGTRHVA